MKKTTRQTMKKTLAALLIAASTASLCAPAYAEDTPALSKSAYTVTENEQGTVTIAFNEPIVLSLKESYVGNETEEDDGIIPCDVGDPEGLDYIKKEYRGAYISTDDKYYISIRGEKHITMRIKDSNYDGEIFCNGDHVTKVFLNEAATKSDNFNVDYAQYTQIREPKNIVKNEVATIIGRFSKSDRTFTINSIKLYFA